MNTQETYILDGKVAVAEPDRARWGEWMASSNRTVLRDTIDAGLAGQPGDEVVVSTVFLGLDHSFDGGPPLLFETLVLGGALDQDGGRCSTWEEAEKMHEEMCERVRGGSTAVRDG